MFVVLLVGRRLDSELEPWHWRVGTATASDVSGTHAGLAGHPR